jgi:HEAT repeat protein
MSAVETELAARLADPSPEVRRRAVADLGKLPLADQGARVRGALADEDWRVRKEMIAQLIRSPSGPALSGTLIDAAIQVGDIGLRNAAAEALAGLGASAVTDLAARLPALEPSGRIIGCEVIGRSRDPRAGELLVAALADPDPNLRVCAAEWLGEHGGDAAVAALTACLGGTDRLLALAALQSLNGLGACLPCAALMPLVDDPLWGAEIVIALGRCGDPAAAPLIAARLRVEPSAARALERLHDGSKAAAAQVEQVLAATLERDLAALEPLAREGEPGDQRAALRCLMWSRRREFVPLFAELARDEGLHPLLLEGLAAWGSAAEEALEDLLPGAEKRELASVLGLLARLMEPRPGRDEVARFAAHLESTDPVVATAAAGVMARFGDERVVKRLIELCGDDVARVRRAAGHALVEIGRREPAAVRRAVLGVELEGERGVELCRALEVVGRAGDAALLAGALGSPHLRLRRAAIGALAAVAKDAAVETISMAMTDEDLGVQMAAAVALARIGPAAAETILSGLAAATGPLKAVLIRALGQVGHPEAPAILRRMCREGAAEAIAALEALKSLGLEPKEIADEILAHPDAEVVKRALASLGAAVTPGQLAGLLGHRAWDVRLAAVERFAEAAPAPAALAALRGHRQRETDDLVRRAIERILLADRAQPGRGEG